MASGNNIVRLIALPDIHAATKPGQIANSWEPDLSDGFYTAMEFLADFKPHITILMGDLMDFGLVSHWEDDAAPLNREGRRLEYDFLLANQILDYIDRYTLKHKVYIMGNHDYRLFTYLAQNPHLIGIVDLWKALKMHQRKNWEVVDFGKVYRYGDASFTHGWYWNKYHAAKTVGEVGDNIFYGHTHDIQSYCKPNIQLKPIVGQSLGCLTHISPDYKKNRPTNNVNAFGVFYFLTNGHFTYYTPIIIEGVMVWNGKIYHPDRIKRLFANDGSECSLKGGA